jgi:hypothetical protein
VSKTGSGRYGAFDTEAETSDGCHKENERKNGNTKDYGRIGRPIFHIVTKDFCHRGKN